MFCVPLNLVEIIMDQNPLDDSQSLYAENDQQVNGVESSQPNSRNNQNVQFYQGRYQMFLIFYLFVIFKTII